jgi:hypothetical protein
VERSAELLARALNPKHPVMEFSDFQFQLKQMNPTLGCRADKVNFWQERLPQWQPHHLHAAATPFYSTKSKQVCSLGSLASHGGPEVNTVTITL